MVLIMRQSKQWFSSLTWNKRASAEDLALQRYLTSTENIIFIDQIAHFGI